MTLPICDGETDAEQPDKTVSPIFDTSRLSLRRPGHDLPETTTMDSLAVIGSEHCFGNAGDVLERENFVDGFSVVVDRGGGEGSPVLVIKLEPSRGQELLQCPASCEPWFAVPVRVRGGLCEVDDEFTVTCSIRVRVEVYM